MTEPSEYSKTMLDNFIERYNDCPLTTVHKWKNLPWPVRAAMAAAFLATAEQIQEELY